MGAPAGDDLTALFGRHALAETMPALADDFARLIGALHGDFSGKTRFEEGAVLLREVVPLCQQRTAGIAASRSSDFHDREIISRWWRWRCD
jgi:hypothetical protein